MDGHRSEPLSIETLLQKQREEKEAASKVCLHAFSPPVRTSHTDHLRQPKFLSKEERAKLAIAKRAQEIKEEKERAEAARRDRLNLETQADELRRERDSKYGGSGRC
jgi:ATP-dependent RNA helicase DDX23/PRP28